MTPALDLYSYRQLQCGYLLETDVLQPPPGSFVRDAGGGDGPWLGQRIAGDGGSLPVYVRRSFMETVPKEVGL